MSHALRRAVLASLHLDAASAGLAILVAIHLGSCDGGGGGSNPTASVPVTVGCYSASYAGVAPQRIGCGISPTLGDPGLDQLSNQEYLVQAD